MASDTTNSPRGNPRVLELGSAVMEIRQACDELGSEAHRSPFFFITGAGISYPPVPLASTIIEHCRGVAGRYQRRGEPEGAQTLDTYSYWFGRAYPGARQRQQYLRTLIDRKPLSLASLRLGHLLSARRLTNLVVTTNFDDFIARALRLFGVEPAVCDHARTVGRIDRDREDVQILHVHGSYLFYDCANLRGEVTDRARADDETSFTMVGLLDSLLWTRSPLVIGYAGWDGDVIMSALKRRLRGGNPLAQSVYWFCYRRADLDQLPAWVRNSPDVRFVVPPEAAAASPEAAGARQGQPPGSTRGEVQGADATEPTMPALAVLDQLNRAFDIGAPALFENPIESFARSLQAALPPTDGAAGDPYGFKSLIERLFEASRHYGQLGAARPRDPTLERLRVLMRESQYLEALVPLAQFVPAGLAGLAADERAEVISAAQLAAPAVLDRLADAPIGKRPLHVLVFDAKLDRTIGPQPPGVAWLMASHTGRLGYETSIDGEAHGAFSHALVDALREPAADVDRDGRISLLEASVRAARRMLDAADQNRQLPAVAGDAAAIAWFASRRNVPARGTLHALLIAMDRFPWGTHLNGPRNDVAGMAELLNTRERRLHVDAEVIVLRNEAATVAEVGRALAALCTKAMPDDSLLVYYSGVGMRGDPDADTATPARIMAVLDGFDESTGEGMLTHRMLMDALATTKAGQKVVILDF